MNSTEPTGLCSLQPDVDQLRHRVRVLTRILGASLLGVTGCALCAFRPTDEIRASAFILVDSSGIERGRFAMDGEAAQLRLVDVGGSALVTLVAAGGPGAQLVPDEVTDTTDRASALAGLFLTTEGPGGRSGITLVATDTFCLDTAAFDSSEGKASTLDVVSENGSFVNREHSKGDSFGLVRVSATSAGSSVFLTDDTTWRAELRCSAEDAGLHLTTDAGDPPGTSVVLGADGPQIVLEAVDGRTRIERP